MLKITKDINLKDFSGLKVGSQNPANLYSIETLSDFEELLETLGESEVGKMVVVGEGSNTVFVNENKTDNLNLLRIDFKNIVQHENTLKVGAGMDWDTLVQKYIELGGVGMESLSAIPGTVGAAPVQNIGAYGKEVSEFIDSVEVYDRQENEYKTLNNIECKFKYRDSIFKHEKNRYIILYVNFKNPSQPPFNKGGESAQVYIPDYRDIKNYLQQRNIITKASDLWGTVPLSEGEGLGVRRTLENVTIQDIREAVVEVRKLKLPNPNVIANCGSFFKNPIINRTELKKLKGKFPEIPVFPVEGMKSGVSVDSEWVKIPAAYIIEKIGLKGMLKGNFGIHKNHALILTSNGQGSVFEFLEFINFIKQKVHDSSGLMLEEEVNLI